MFLNFGQLCGFEIYCSKKIKGTIKQHLKSKNKKKVGLFNKIISFIQIYDVLF